MADGNGGKRKAEEIPQNPKKALKWKTLHHEGPYFAAPYEPLPNNVYLLYNNKTMRLSPHAEEAAGFYSGFIEHEYATKALFNQNFFNDWQKLMTTQERSKIKNFEKCNFSLIAKYYKEKAEERKSRSKEEKEALKIENRKIEDNYGYCKWDGDKEKIGNFKIEPPGLFRGRGNHPKMGMIKSRVYPEDVTINCSKDAKIPKPPNGHSWKKVVHDQSVAWLAHWVENVQGQYKYVMLHSATTHRGNQDLMKFEKARELGGHIEDIKEIYLKNLKDDKIIIREISVAIYLIDKFALRVGNEKGEDEADTVGCCSLRCEHVDLKGRGRENGQFVVCLNFLGKDSIQFCKNIHVIEEVYENIKNFKKDKKKDDFLFSYLKPQILNKYLNELMAGLTSKVFRTYNASLLLENSLKISTKEEMSLEEKISAYNAANREVALFCNHQRAIPKSHEKTMGNLKNKKINVIQEISDIRRQKKTEKDKKKYEKLSKRYDKLQNYLKTLELQIDEKEKGKQIALGTSKLNYLDPRITISWCKNWQIPVEKIYNKTQREKFVWALDIDENFEFDE